MFCGCGVDSRDMIEEEKLCGCGSECQCKWRHRKSRHAAGAGGGAVYGLGLIGAAVYYIQHAETFSAGVIGVLKALVWPAFVVYELLAFLGM
jgi:hypothetical protein